MPSTTAAPAPEVTTPEKDKSYSSPVKFSGTGLAGWWVYFYQIPIDGNVLGSAQVTQAGDWKFEVTLAPGRYKVFGLQMDNRERSDQTPTIEFEVKS